jgi:acyl carrier protein
MSDTDVLEGISEVARQHLGWQGMLAPDMQLVSTLGLDSLRLLTLVVELENFFRIRLEEGDEADIETVSDLMLLVQRRLNGS